MLGGGDSQHLCCCNWKSRASRSLPSTLSTAPAKAPLNNIDPRYASSMLPPSRSHRTTLVTFRACYHTLPFKVLCIVVCPSVRLLRGGSKFKLHTVSRPRSILQQELISKWIKQASRAHPKRRASSSSFLLQDLWSEKKWKGGKKSIREEPSGHKLLLHLQSLLQSRFGDAERHGMCRRCDGEMARW